MQNPVDGLQFGVRVEKDLDLTTNKLNYKVVYYPLADKYFDKYLDSLGWMPKYLKDLFVAKAKGADYYAVEALKEKAKDLNWKLGKSWEKWRQVESWTKSDEFTSSTDTSGK
ncbi:hypothetical protein [Mycoplasmopsis synoviae]|uniref:hypothetical protein n=1 Tax=Mycoplasmopsis synoviae TaxID=2109 RepID=UPI003BA0DCC2